MTKAALQRGELVSGGTLGTELLHLGRRHPSRRHRRPRRRDQSGRRGDRQLQRRSARTRADWAPKTLRQASPPSERCVLVLDPDRDPEVHTHASSQAAASLVDRQEAVFEAVPRGAQVEAPDPHPFGAGEADRLVQVLVQPARPVAQGLGVVGAVLGDVAGDEAGPFQRQQDAREVQRFAVGEDVALGEGGRRRGRYGAGGRCRG